MTGVLHFTRHVAGFRQRGFLPDGISALGEVITGAISARRCVQQILVVSLAYNVVGVILAAAGVWGPLVYRVTRGIPIEKDRRRCSGRT